MSFVIETEVKEKSRAACTIYVLSFLSFINLKCNVCGCCMLLFARERVLPLLLQYSKNMCRDTLWLVLSLGRNVTQDIENRILKM